MTSYQSDYDPIDGQSTFIRATSGTYAERQHYRNPSQRPESYNQPSYTDSNRFSIQGYRLSQQPKRRDSLLKLNEFRKRVHEVVDLCRGQNNDVKGDLNQVITEQRKIYDMLNQDQSLLRRTVSHQSFPPVPQYSQQQGFQYGQPSYNQSQRRQQLTTPFRPLKNPTVPQSQYFVPGMSQVGARQNAFQPNISQSNIIRPESGYFPQPDFVNPQSYGTFGGENAAENLHGSFLKLKNTKQINLNEDALRLIEDIERKAFEEIERLRKQKLQLMQKLNTQIRNVNEEKRKNSQLQNLLSRYSNQPQRPDGSSDNTQFLQAQISRLQGQLQRANQLNHNLRLQLSSRGSGVPGIEELLRQGQAIRQQTLRLLKLKQQGESGQRIIELQRMLQAQRSQKQAVLNEVRALRERQGGQSNVRQPESSYSGFEKSSARGPVQQGKTVGQYQDLVSQMKRITGF